MIENRQLNYANLHLHKYIYDVMMTNVMTNLTSRQRILGFLGQHNGASAAEISLALGLTPADIRHHLAILVSDDRVRVLGTRPETSRGRPVRIFGLGVAAARDNLAALVDMLLSQAMENASPVDQEQVLTRLAARLYSQVTSPASHITLRLAQTVAMLSQSGYAARWEAHAAAPRILFEHCPYAAVIARHPELCRMDQLMLEKRLGGQVEQTARLEQNARGTTFCQFVLNNPKTR